MVKFFKKQALPKPVKKTMEDYTEDALYREVWEDVNNEKTTAFFKKYSRILIATAIGILIIAVSIQIVHQNRQNNKVASLQNYESALNRMDASALSGNAQNSGGAMADLALFQAYLIDNDTAKLETLSKSGQTRDFRDLAKIHLAGIRGDAMTPPEFEKFMSPLFTKKSPYFYNAMLMTAEKYLDAGNKKSANIWLDKIISDKDAPSIISGTAASLK